MAHHERHNRESLLPLILIIGGVPLAIGAGYIGWAETESLLFTLISAGLPLLFVLAGLFSLK
ncbi:MAG: hypothetical protein NTV22_03695 [bacterium]|nr:hypothetical protein [bacterium]